MLMLGVPMNWSVAPGPSHNSLHQHPCGLPWFAADSKAAGSSLQPVVQCGLLKSELTFLPLPCLSHVASPCPPNTLDTSSGCRGRDKSSDAAGEAEVKFTVGAVTLSYKTLCMQRPSTLTQYFSSNLLANLEAATHWKWINSHVSRVQCSPANESMSPENPVTCISSSLPFPRRKQGKWQMLMIPCTISLGCPAAYAKEVA